MPQNDSVTVKIERFKNPLIDTWLNGKKKIDIKFMCDICDPRPDATLEECSEWPGHYLGCAKKDGHNIYPDFECNGKGILTRKEIERK